MIVICMTRRGNAGALLEFHRCTDRRQDRPQPHLVDLQISDAIGEVSVRQSGSHFAAEKYFCAVYRDSQLLTMQLAMSAESSCRWSLQSGQAVRRQ
jgi:hypothetical protein